MKPNSQERFSKRFFLLILAGMLCIPLTGAEKKKGGFLNKLVPPITVDPKGGISVGTPPGFQPTNFISPPTVRHINLLDTLASGGKNLGDFANLKAPSDIVTSNPLPVLGDRRVNYQALTNASENDRVLYQYRLALWEMRQRNPSAAQELFRAALETVDNRFGKDKNTERASKLFHNEAEKTFVGEPYERAMANVYYGFLQLAAGQTNEARASFKSAEWEDSWALVGTGKGVVTNMENQADFVLPYYLRGLGVAKEDGTLMYDATTNACKLFPAPPAYAYDPSHNVVLLIDYGTGPQKYLAGKDGHELQFYDGTANFKSVRITVDTNSTTVSAGPYDDITFQAITRGGRVMDHVNKRKSQVKEGAKVVGWGAIIASAASAAAGVDSRVAAGVMVGGMLLQVASNQIQPKADARCWDNLPQFVTCATLALPPGQHVAKVEFLDANNAVGLTRTVKLDVAENQFCAAYVSEFSAQ